MLHLFPAKRPDTDTTNIDWGWHRRMPFFERDARKTSDAPKSQSRGPQRHLQREHKHAGSSSRKPRHVWFCGLRSQALRKQLIPVHHNPRTSPQPVGCRSNDFNCRLSIEPCQPCTGPKAQIRKTEWICLSLWPSVPASRNAYISTSGKMSKLQVPACPQHVVQT
jgi:hypothetical protein